MPGRYGRLNALRQSRPLENSLLTLLDTHHPGARSSAARRVSARLASSGASVGKFRAESQRLQAATRWPRFSSQLARS